MIVASLLDLGYIPVCVASIQFLQIQLSSKVRDLDSAAEDFIATQDREWLEESSEVRTSLTFSALWNHCLTFKAPYGIPCVECRVQKIQELLKIFNTTWTRKQCRLEVSIFCNLLHAYSLFAFWDGVEVAHHLKIKAHAMIRSRLIWNSELRITEGTELQKCSKFMELLSMNKDELDPVMLLINEDQLQSEGWILLIVRENLCESSNSSLLRSSGHCSLDSAKYKYSQLSRIFTGITPVFPIFFP